MASNSEKPSSFGSTAEMGDCGLHAGGELKLKCFRIGREEAWSLSSLSGVVETGRRKPSSLRGVSAFSRVGRAMGIGSLGFTHSADVRAAPISFRGRGRTKTLEFMTPPVLGLLSSGSGGDCTLSLRANSLTGRATPVSSLNRISAGDGAFCTIGGMYALY